MSPTPLQPPEATARSIDSLLGDAKNGKIRIPQFQRNFRWEQKHIRDLFDSIYRGYPIGSLLFWDTDKTEGAAARFGPMTFGPASGRAYLVVDGQQRFTTLVATLLREREPEGPEEEHFLVFFDLDEERFLTPKPQEPRPTSWLPLNEILDTLRYLEWLEALPRDANRERFVQAANRVARALRDYKIPVYIVRSEDEQELRRIFERLNSSGKALKQEEIFRAITGQRDQLDALQEDVARLGFGELDKELLIASIGAVIEIEPGGDRWEQIRARASAELTKNIADTARALGHAIRFILDDAQIVRFELLPHRDPVVVLAKLFHSIPELSMESRSALSRWLWRGACSGRHAMNPSQLHLTLRCVDGGERASIASLTKQFDDFKLPTLRFLRHDFRSAATKLLCNALVALAPRHIETGDRVAVPELIEHMRANAFAQIVPRRRVDDEKFEKSDTFRGTGNRMVHPHLFDRRFLVDALREEVSQRLELRPLRDGTASLHDVFRSHAIDQSAIVALMEERFAEFLLLREIAVKAHATAYLRERCGVD